jgi:L-fucose mutarotase
VLADAHFPGETYGQRVLRADGLKIPDLLDAMLPLFALDTYAASPLIMMCAVPGDELDPAMEVSYRQTIDKHWPDTPPIQRIDRFEMNCLI